MCQEVTEQKPGRAMEGLTVLIPPYGTDGTKTYILCRCTAAYELNVFPFILMTADIAVSLFRK